MKKIYYPMFAAAGKGEIYPVHSVLYDDLGRVIEVTIWCKDDFVTLEKGEFELLTGGRCYPHEGYEVTGQAKK